MCICAFAAGLLATFLLLTTSPDTKVQSFHGLFLRQRNILQDLLGGKSQGLNWKQQFDECERAGWELQKERRGPPQGLAARIKKADSHASHIKAAGFNETEAEMLHCLSGALVCRAMGHTLREGDRKYAAISQAFYNAVANRALQEVKTQQISVPKLYKSLKELQERDDSWEILANVTDSFQSVTSFAPITGLRPPIASKYHPQGIKDSGDVVSTPVVCFVSRPYDHVHSTLHSAVCTMVEDDEHRRYTIPPLTIFTVVSDTGEKGRFEYLPGQYINQRLITVQLTYTIPKPPVKMIQSTRSNIRKKLEDLIGPKPEGGCWKQQYQLATQCTSKDLSERLCPSRMEKHAAHIKAAGFNDHEAEMLSCVCEVQVCRAMGKNLEKGEKDLAMLTHMFYQAIAKRALQSMTNQEPVPPHLYKDLHGLQERDPAWGRILEKDAHGFRGFTSFCPITGLRPACLKKYHEKGLMSKTGPIQSDVVRFVSRPHNPAFSTLHSAVCVYQEDVNRYVIPPLTLFKVIEEEPGEFEYLPGKRIKQRLITVQMTYMVPPSVLNNDEEAVGANGRFLSRITDLRYGSLNDAEGGISVLLNDPVLTMEAEFARDDTWVDWQGTAHSGLAEWNYVTGPAKEGEKNALTHDKGHHGWTPEYFLSQVNAKLQKEMHLEMEEMLAVRLYTGAPYQVINKFLRAVSSVQGIWRKVLVENPKVCVRCTIPGQSLLDLDLVVGLSSVMSPVMARRLRKAWFQYLVAVYLIICLGM